MINFKKRLRERVEAWQQGKPAPVQTLLDLQPAPPAQTEMLVCQLCGHTWMTDNAETVRRAWRSFKGVGPLCDCCWLLHSISIMAGIQKRSLKSVVWAFLKGMSKRKHVPWRNIWLDK